MQRKPKAPPALQFIFLAALCSQWHKYYELLSLASSLLPLEAELPSSWKSTTKKRKFSCQRSTTNGRELKFLHIPKTGGSVIEQVAASAGYSWGYCMFQDGTNTKDVCPRNNDALRISNLDTNNMWHFPIQHLPPKARSLYGNASIFTVIRNPYHRVLSEYYYRCAFHRKCNQKINNSQHMNQWITNAIHSATNGEKSYFFHGGH